MIIISFPDMPTKTKELQPNEVLSLRDNAKNQLLQIRTVEDGISYLNKLKSIETWVKAEKKDAELQNIVAEQKLRTQRLLGELLKESKRKGIMLVPADNLKVGPEVVEPDHGKTTLSEFGLTKDQSSAFQQIADIPDEEFENYISKKKDEQNKIAEEITTAGILRFARSLGHETPSPQQHIPAPLIQFKQDSTPEERLKELATYINLNFSKEEKAMLITMIFPN